jgi:hypothetical protein
MIKYLVYNKVKTDKFNTVDHNILGGLDLTMTSQT